MAELSSILRNNVTARLAAEEVAISMQVRLVESIEIAQIAQTCGYDSLYVDLEHSALTLRQTGQICMSAMQVGVTPFVRVANRDASTISRTLDAGAMGIIVPHVQTADDARQVVEAARFPPFGHRSVSVGLPQLQFRTWPVDEARRLMNANTTVVTMIEGPGALERVDEIAAVEGVDILFIGTNDLCAELGIDGQFDHPLVRQAFEKTIAASRARGKHVGIGGLSGRPDLLKQFIKLGALYVSAGSDMQYLIASAKQRCDLIRDAAKNLA